MDASKKVFINSAWTAAGRVPSKSARGVDLVYDTNAFATISAAKTKLGGFSGNGLYVADRSVKLNNVTGIAMISSVEPIVVEAYKATGTTSVADTMAVKLAGIGDINIKANTGANVIVQGYKDATIDGINDGMGAAYQVVGGNNAVTRSYAFADKGGNTARQWTATIASTAFGNLDVQNVDALTVNSLICDYSDTVPGWISKSGEANILPTGVEATYANVTLKNTAAGSFNGGTFRENAARKRTDATDGSYTDAYKATEAAAASGKLTVTNSTIGEVDGYSTVTITGTPAWASTTVPVFVSINGASLSYSEEASNVYAVKGTNTVLAQSGKRANTTRTAGKAALTDVVYGGTIEGYATVTVTDSNIWLAVAGTRSESAKTTNEVVTGGAESLKQTTNTTQAVSESGTFTGKATDALAPNEVTTNLIGYNRVTLTNTDVYGTIAATNEFSGAFNSSFSQATTSATTAAGDVSEVTESKDGYTETATGSVAVTGGSIQSGIVGYSNVNLKGTDAAYVLFDGELEAGNYRYEDYYSSRHTVRGTADTTIEANTTKDTYTANGTLTISKGQALNINDPEIEGFQTVNLTDVKGVIADGIEGGNNIDAIKDAVTTNNAITSRSLTRAQKLTATGSVNIKNTDTDDNFEVSDIEGYNKVQISDATDYDLIVRNIVGGNYTSDYSLEGKNLEDDSWIVTRFTSLEDGSDYAIGAESRTVTSKLVGTVALTSANVAADVDGYSTVTLASAAIVNGNVNFVDLNGDGENDPLVTKMTQRFEKNYESRTSSTSKTATAAVTLKKGVEIGGTDYATQIAGNVGNVNKLTLEQGLNAEITTVGGNVDMVNSKWAQEEGAVHNSKGDTLAVKTADIRTAAGTINMGQLTEIIGGAEGVKTLTMKGTLGNQTTIYGDVEGFNISRTREGKVVTKEGDILTLADIFPTDPTPYAQYESMTKTVSTAVGAATMNYAQVGVLSGFSKVTMTNGYLTDQITGGKIVDQDGRKYSNVEKNSQITISDIETHASSRTAIGTVNASSTDLTGAAVSGFQTVTFNQVDGGAGQILGGDFVQSNVINRYNTSDTPTINAYKQTVLTSATAKGAFTATGVIGGALTFDTVSGFGIPGGLGPNFVEGGFSSVKITSGNVTNDIAATTYVERTSASDNGSQTQWERNFTSKYVGSVEVTDPTADAMVGPTLNVGGNINGYASVTLNGVTVGGDINVNDYDEMFVVKQVFATKHNSDTPVVEFSSVTSQTASATTVLTLKAGAIVTNGAANISKLTVTPGAQVGPDTDSRVTMFNTNIVGSSSVVIQNDSTYIGTEKNSMTRTPNGTVTISGSAGTANDTKVVNGGGRIEGVKTLAATSAFIGDVEGYLVSATQRRTASSAAITTTDDGYGNIIAVDFDNGVSGTYWASSTDTAKAEVSLTETTANIISGAESVKLVGAIIAGANSYSTDNTEEWKWTSTDAAGWTGDYEYLTKTTGTLTATSNTVTATPTQINGDVEGFNSVELRDGTIANANFVGGATTQVGAYANGSGTQVTTVVTEGALNAAGKTLNDGTVEYVQITGNINGFASVALDRTQVTGDLTGGDLVQIDSFNEYGWDATARTFTLESSTVTAAGTLSAKDSEIVGTISEFANVSFSGENNFVNSAAIIDGVATLNVQDGATVIDSYVGRDADDIVTVDGTLQVANGFDFKDGDDVLSIGGTVSLLSDTATIDGLEVLGGSGILAMTDTFYGADWNTVKATIGTIDPALTILHSDAAVVKAIRSKSYELGDNGGSGYTIAAVAGDTTGWMCDDKTVGFEGTTGFEDKIDCFNFTVKNGTLTQIDLAFDYDDGVTLEGKLWQGSTLVDDTLADGWSHALADGNYTVELKLTSSGNGQLAYTVTLS